MVECISGGSALGITVAGETLEVASRRTHNGGRRADMTDTRTARVRSIADRFVALRPSREGC